MARKRTESAKKNERQHRIGEYVADYSHLTPKEINAPDPELEELYANSKPVQGHSESDKGDNAKS